MIRGFPAASRRRIARSRAEPAAAKTSTASSARGRFRSGLRNSSVPPGVRDRPVAACAATTDDVGACRAWETARDSAEPAAGAASEKGRSSSSGSSGKTRGSQGGVAGLLGPAPEIGDRTAIRIGGRTDAGAVACDARASGPVSLELGRAERPTPCRVGTFGDAETGGCTGTTTTAGRVSSAVGGVAAGAGAAAWGEGSARDSGNGGPGAEGAGAGAETTGADTGAGAGTGNGACSAGGGAGVGTTRRGGRSPSGST
jgi:hypothetical protein